MFEENRERPPRRNFDGWKLLPLVGSFGMAIFSWGISVETRLGSLTAMQTERAPILERLQGDVSDLQIAVGNKALPPEMAKSLDKLWDDHNKFRERLEYFDTRVNNLHQFLLQKPPINLPSRRGEGPFRLEDNG